MKLTQETVETAIYEGRSHRSKSGRKRWSQHVLRDDELPVRKTLELLLEGGGWKIAAERVP